MPTSEIPYVVIRGAPYQRGVIYGRACGDLIRRYAHVLLEVLGPEGRLRALALDRPISRREDLSPLAMRFLPAFEAFAPHLVEEMRGIADGAQVPLADVLLVNVRAEVMGLASADALCTAFAVGRHATSDGSLLSGQNLDQHPLNRELLVMLKVEPDIGPAILMCTFAGLVGYPGVNDRGVSVFQNALSTAVWRSSGMPQYLLKRVLLEQADVAGCVTILNRAAVCSSSNYVLTDRGGVLLDIELTPDGFARLEPDRDIIVHANHFVSDVFAPEDALLSTLPDSARRVPRLKALLDAKRGSLTVDDLKALLADHEGSPTGICRHQHDVETIASIIAEPDQGRMHVAFGQPCTEGFNTYSL